MLDRPKQHPRTTTSRDGTRIAYDRVGNGPTLIMVLGAFNDRLTGAPLSTALADRFTVINYDRRGRGDSGDTQPYAVEREIEDLASLIDIAGGSASVFGFSAGAALALRAAASLSIDRLVLFGTPFITDASRPPLPGDLAQRVEALVEDGRRGEAVELFQTEAVGIPKDVVVKLREAPFRPALEAMAHTLFYDLSIVGDGSIPEALLASVTMPSLVIAGADGPPFISHTAEMLGRRLPNATHASVPGLTQDLVVELLAPVVREFLARG